MNATQNQRWEWPTLAVAAAIYLTFGVLTLNHEVLPWWALVLGGGYVTAWHGSLQHEVVHGHPTPSPALNELLVFPSLWLWLPFRLYRRSHLKHHDTGVITDPLEDPESYYLTPTEWSACGKLRRLFLIVNNTVAGRLIFGPAICIKGVIAGEGRRFSRGDFSNARAWGMHAAGCALVVGWTYGVCGISLLEYVLWFAYPGVSLTLLRSFAEHQASFDHDERTVIVKSGPLMSLLYLNNNLHAVHHAEPGMAWYQLPLRARECPRERYVFRGYGEIVARYLLRPKETVEFPL
ncbi:MAG TPA: fatty acid desaturase [Gammaproteobacteria bacterium]|nr:fatty acid desaturase [Gammaproteobacteria bacterium]